MRLNLDDYHRASARTASRPPPLPEPRANFLGSRQDAALSRRVIGGLFVCAVLVAASLFLVS